MGTKLYVGNLNFRTTDDSLAAAFTQHGCTPASVKVITDRETGRSRGFAFVDMPSDEAAAHALTTMNDKDVEGRSIKLTEARAREPGGGGGFSGPRPGGYAGGGSAGGGGGGYPPRNNYGSGAPRNDAPRYDAPRSRPDGDARPSFRSQDSFAPRPPSFVPPSAPPFEAEEPREGRRDRSKRRDLSKQHSRHDDDEDDDY